MQGSIMLHFPKPFVPAGDERQSRQLGGGTSDPISPSAGKPWNDLWQEKDEIPAILSPAHGGVWELDDF